MLEIFKKALEGRIHQCGSMPTAQIIFSPDLLKACEQNVCGKYNASWTCPPAIEPMAKQMEKILSFSHAFVFTTKGILEDSFDFEGMQEAGRIHRELSCEMHDLFGKTNPVYGAGSCSLCKPCFYPEPCRFPDRLFLAIEAAGINVTELSRSALVNYNNGENTVTFFSIILYNENQEALG